MLSGELIYRHADHTYTLKPVDTLLFDLEGGGCTARKRWSRCP